MNKIIFVFLILLQPAIIFAQVDMRRLTEMQKIFFVSEVSGLASSTYNPAAMSSRPDISGVVLGYDFDDFKIQGNSSAFLLLNNFGFSYQDVYNINNFRLQNYAINLSVGNEFLSIGTINRYSKVSYQTFNLEGFSLDAGIIFKPVKFISLGLLARNLGNVGFDSVNYKRNYTAGIGLSFFNDTFRLYADADFRDYAKINDLSGTLGIVIATLNFLEFRSGIILNPDDILELTINNPEVINLKYEAFISFSFLIKDTIRVTASNRFNDLGERTRFSFIFGFPLTKPGY